MRRVLTILLLVVVVAVTNNYCSAETGTEEMPEDLKEFFANFDEEVQIYVRMEKVEKILDNGLMTYPNISEGETRMREILLDLPDFSSIDAQSLSALSGTPYLLTGKVTKTDGAIIYVDFDGIPAKIICYCYIDQEKKQIKSGARFPQVGEEANFFVTYYTIDPSEYIPGFLLGSTDKEKELIFK